MIEEKNLTDRQRQLMRFFHQNTFRFLNSMQKYLNMANLHLF